MLYKRVRSLVAFWGDGGLSVRNYARGKQTIRVTPESLELLDALTYWQTEEDLRGRVTEPIRESVAARLVPLVAAGIVESTATPQHAAEEALEGWADWGPSAAFFHLDTKDVPYVDRSTNADRADRRLLLDPPPARYDEDDAVPLPAFRRSGPFPAVLLARRSWRRFGHRAVTLDELSTVLGLTWGTQHWMHLRQELACPLKTSPSGGASHSLEVYVVATRVRGLAPGVYRYGPDAHGLTRIDERWPSERIAESLGGQAWAAEAGAVFFMTAVFPRIQWKYKFGRAYRAVLLEAGHFCQTFCLVSTWLKLAPFCTAALGDTLIERHLRIDGITESVIYAMGMGSRPRRTAWAPWPDNAPLPERSAPEHQRRKSASRRRARKYNHDR